MDPDTGISVHDSRPKCGVGSITIFERANYSGNQDLSNGYIFTPTIVDEGTWVNEIGGGKG